MRVAITGSAGQLGQALQTTLSGEDLLLLDLPEHDITAHQQTSKLIIDFRPDVVVHTAAFTNVDQCELEPETAYRVNGLGTQNIALSCQRCDAAMVYISTDYVFDGAKSDPY